MKCFCTVMDQREILPESLPFLREDMLFFDIETTGLSSAHAQIYCIGIGYQKEDSIRIEVRILDRNDEEEALIGHFVQVCAAFKTIVTFNGNRFDLPFLRARAALYGIEDPFVPLAPLDLYKKSASFRKLLPLTHYRQKSFEAFLGIGREDLYNGGELIAVYHRYAKTHQETDLTNLYTHNCEDVRGMFSLLSLLSYEAFMQGNFAITAYHRQKDRFHVRAELSKAVPQTVRILRPDGNLILRGSEAFFELPVYKRTLRHYFPNYKDYYYLPEEGIAVHKSIGAYVPAGRRERATRANCYAEKECFCLHAEKASALRYLQEDERDTSTWLKLPAEPSSLNPDDLRILLDSYIRSAAERTTGRQSGQ